MMKLRNIRKIEVGPACGYASDEHVKKIYLISDASGDLLEHFFNAILTQFPKQRFDIHPIPFIKETNLSHALAQINKGIVFHALASGRLKRVVSELCLKYRLPCWDATGPTVDFLEDTSGIQRCDLPRPIHGVHAGYARRAVP